MQVIVVFQYPDIVDLKGHRADLTISELTLELKNAGINCDSWAIEEVMESDK
jgi:hypothetical protein